MKESLKKERDIWNAFKAGELQAFGYLYRLYVKKLYAYGTRFVPDTGMVKDAIHDLFVRLWQKRSSLGEPVSVKNYLYKSFRCILFRKLERESRYLSDEITGQHFRFNFELSVDEKIVRDEEKKKRVQQLNAAIAVLTPRQREIIYLKFYEELSYEEIAGALSISAKACYKLTSRAITRLREEASMSPVV